jgi:citrate synthase
MLKDSLFLISVLPKIAALIYRGTFKDGILGSPSHTDLAEDFSRMIGWKDEKFFEALRLFLVIHADHEGSNVSTHAARLVASAGGNVFEAFAAGLNGLAGPSHGMGMQNCLMWLVDLWRTLGENIDEKSVEIAVRAFLMKDGKVPGFGHPVLRNVDERFLAQFEFAGKHLKGDPLCEIIRIVSQVTPRVMKEMGMNVLYPNMYLHSAAILFHYGLRMYEYYCVLFGFSRAVGIVSNVVWDVALQLPMEEIQSVTLEELERLS